MWNSKATLLYLNSKPTLFHHILKPGPYIPIRHGQLRQFMVLSINQGFFFFSPPFLNLFFAVEGMVNSGINFQVDKFYWQVFFGVVGTFTGLVLGKPAGYVFGATGVVTAIAAKEDVHAGLHN